MATGAYVRIEKKREGAGTEPDSSEWVNVEIDQLTNEELDRFLTGNNSIELYKWAKFLASWIRDNVEG